MTRIDPRSKRLCLSCLSSALLSLFVGCASPPPPPPAAAPSAPPEEKLEVDWCKSGPPAPQLTQPKVAKGEAAIFTPEAIAAGVKASLPVHCMVLPDGRLINCALLEPVPTMELAVYKALLNWQFKPALLDGAPAPVEVNINVPVDPPQPAKAPAAGEAPPAAPGAASLGDRGQTPANPLPFGVGMEKPKAISPPNPVATRNARRACIQGEVLAKCVITTEGTLTDCTIIKSLPYMDQAILDALKAAKFAPVLFQGKPVNVEYVIPFRFKL